MIKQIRAATVPWSIKKLLRRLAPLSGGEWDSGKPGVKDFKQILMAQMLKIQDNKCAFCGLELGETSRPEIEHIVAKGGCKRPAHPEYAFHRFNLAVACTFCNGSSKKGQKDVLLAANINYRLCDFSIVHPIVDDPELHYKWVNEDIRVVVSGISDKGKASIELFGLYTTQQSEARAKQIVWEALKKNQSQLIKSILDKKSKR